MFAVVGLTLDDIWSGALPQVRLAKALEGRTASRSKLSQSIVIYTTDPGDTQGPATRTKYKDRGTFLTLLYFNDAAIDACNEFQIPLKILDHINESALPARKVIAFEHPSATPSIK